MDDFDNKNEEANYYTNKLENETEQPFIRISSADEDEENPFNKEDDFGQNVFEEEDDLDDNSFNKEDDFVRYEEERSNSNINSKDNISINAKIAQLIKSYEEIKKENKDLLSEVELLNIQNQALKEQLQRIEKEIVLKTINEDDIIKQIEAVLNK